MGIDARKVPLPLPAPTETDTTTPTELTSTELSKPGDEKSSYSIPDDGTPVTIRTRGHKASKSQTSLLIEYFEGGRSSVGGSTSTERKPSVRVRLTPSRKGRGDHIQLTESTKGSRKASVTRRIPLDNIHSPREIELTDGDDSTSMTSYASATEESTVSRNPIDIEIDRGERSYRRRRPASPLIPSEAATYQAANASEISAIPADSFLDGSGSGPGTDVKRGVSPSRGEAVASESHTNADSTHKSRSGGRERVKLSDKSKERPERKRRTKSRTSNVSSERRVDESPRRRSSRGLESAVSAVDSSVVSSNFSQSHRSVETHSNRSGASKSSINNPKLLETVEDAIRRLILPELSALKREQSKRETRRDSVTSEGTSISREDLVTPDRRRSSGQRSESTRDGSRLKERRNREARHEYVDSSSRSISRESMNDDYRDHDTAPSTPRRGDLLKAAAAGAALSKGLSLLDDKSQSDERKQRDRRRRRTDTSRSRSLGRDRHVEEYEEEEWAPAPPMPLMSEGNPSELTRTSILSAESDRPHSASEEMIHDIPRAGNQQGGATYPQSPDNLLHPLGTAHANVSHGDLTALPRENKEGFAEEYETDEYGRKIPIRYHDEYVEDDPEYSDQGDYPEQTFEEQYYHTQDVPPPLKYVPYQAGARGLSPIPSVSGYTEGGSEAQHPRHSRSLHSAASDAYPSPSKSMDRGAYGGSAGSLRSTPSNLRSREFDQYSMSDESVRSAGKLSTDSEAGGVPSKQPVQGIGANPNFVHPPLGVESAVASLVDGSMLDQSVLTSGSPYGLRDSTLSYDARTQSSRDRSPEKQSSEDQRDFTEERHATPGARSQAQSQEYSEYDVDDHGRKVPVTRTKYRQSPTASEAAITAGAVGAAAAALKAAQERQHAPGQDTEDYVPAGVNRNRSFKQRTQDGWEPRNTPTHSVDRFSFEEEPEPKFGYSGLPDMDYPDPALGYIDEDARTNSSIMQDRLDREDDGQLSGRATPTQRSIAQERQQQGTPGDNGLGISETLGAAAAAGAAAGLATGSHSRQASQEPDEWQRTSDDRKRETLLTNPYEDASPIVNPNLNENILGARNLPGSFGPQYHTGSPNFAQKFDEGYMSNRSPDVEPKGKAALTFADANKPAMGEDPFYVSKDVSRHFSGMSQGMASPFYDAATGAGIDRIENKDIVSLMQHLMVRDAQRSARDTEIIALLMNAALEMRQSFQEMKELMQDTGDDIIFANVENTEKLQKAINGPRPFPGTVARSIQSGSQPGTDDSMMNKKKNLWKRALAGLGAKGTNDLSRIEDMLMQLLGEVDVLKNQTAPPGSSGRGQSIENLQPEGQYEQDQGYEPEGVSTASYASHSGHLSIQSRGTAAKIGNDRKLADNRVSTVQEHDDEYQFDHHSPSNRQAGSTANLDETPRGGSLPPGSPLQQSPQSQQVLSADNTPRTEKGKKHKSSSSSGWLPKISRWSESTATSVGRALRGSGKKDAKYDDQPLPSRSGSSLGSYDPQGYEHDPYGEDKLHTGFSDPSLAPTSQAGTSQQPFQSSTSGTEDPKYRAHRNSLNLQHPQPRPGQSYRNALENSAQQYNDPMTPKSADWAGSVTSLNRMHHGASRYSETPASPVSATREAENWPTSPGSNSGPPRPPKEPLDASPGVTPSKARISRLAKGSPLSQTYDDGYSYTSPTGSPKPENRNLNAALGVPTRRPSGPRAMTPKNHDDDQEKRRKRDTFGSVASHETDTF
ncbi:unnamed protein product [Clonostachys chloroleuca]|uniref:Uncharacterized protein n=1 Tax=Clonostachys chloroleuca TaxID=1926264 RepID=A0AA35QEF7_9HYPO|nr:unnamed protein product [Clonostachys chloroleuca]